ncbi:MAG: exodeoxyribonuclease VII large subunit [Chthoniobacterales bacterium]|nr:exodeoxyribonuclease VII large subunit [Chthoniobacterales bacterium]
MQSDFFQQTSKVLTVAELTRAIRGTLETRFGAVWVQGEISNYKLHPSGHQYFTLKDQRAQIACVIFRNTMPPFPRRLTDGAQVQVYGSLSVFEARGQYQLSVQILQAQGVGLLQAKFEALKRKLEAEGLFASERKRALPKFPQRIGIVTSASGAAISDMLNVLQRRAPALEILINPVRVQGAGAATEIAVAIRDLATPNELWHPLDLIVITRGGGSIEDLWEFNEEIVARAIADSPIPVVSAVGHEIDFTIADFVADLRAPTPSAAAELIVPDAIELRRRTGELASCLDRSLRSLVAEAQQRLRSFSERTLARELTQRLRDGQQKADHARDSLTRRLGGVLVDARRWFESRTQALQSHSPLRELSARRELVALMTRRLAAIPPHAIEAARQRFRHVDGIIRVLGPNATLGRGYSITSDAKGTIIRSVETISRGQALTTQVTDGTFDSKVSER